MSRSYRRKSRAERRSSNRRSEKATGEGTESRSRRARSSEFNPDYSYVKKDLRRIGTLAGFFLAVLVGLSFILN